MAADAVVCCRRRGDIDSYCAVVTMAVAVEVGAVALGASATGPAIDCGVTVAVDTDSACAGDWVVA